MKPTGRIDSAFDTGLLVCLRDDWDGKLQVSFEGSLAAEEVQSCKMCHVIWKIEHFSNAYKSATTKTLQIQKIIANYPSDDYFLLTMDPQAYRSPQLFPVKLNESKVDFKNIVRVPSMS